MTAISPHDRPQTHLTPTAADQDHLGMTFERSAFSHLPLEEQRLFETFGQGRLEPLPHQLIHQAFEAQAKRQPDAVAIDHLGTTVTYRELNRSANRLARHLSSLGVRRGDNVALFLKRSIHLVVGQLAAMKLGAAYVPQHVGVAPRAQLRHILDATDAAVILTLSELSDQVPAGPGEVLIELDRIYLDATPPSDGSDDEFTPRYPVAPEDTSFILFTSGTTGPPNGVKVTHRNICNILLTAPGNLGMAPGLKVAQILSIAFDMAAWETLGSLMNGATLLIRGKDIQATVQQADIVIATPSILGSLDAEACTNIKVAAVAGEPCPRPLADRWGSFCTFFNSCGPTETTIINTAQHYRPGVDSLTIGGPTPNNTVYVLDENLQPCRIGEVGEMWAGGDCVTAGYLDNSSLTAERYARDPFLGGGRLMFRTRDLGRWTKDGSLEHYGRTDDQVKIRGFRVELDSVSAALESVDGCSAAVTFKLDSRTLAAFVQPADVDPEIARQAVAQRLPYYCVPEVVIALDELPRTTRGKIDKRHLAKQLAERADPIEWPRDPRPDDRRPDHQQVSI